jgi:hypothetical protein
MVPSLIFLKKLMHSFWCLYLLVQSLIIYYTIQEKVPLGTFYINAG